MILEILLPLCSSHVLDPPSLNSRGDLILKIVYLMWLLLSPSCSTTTSVALVCGDS